MKDVLSDLFGDMPQSRLSALSTSDSELELLRERNKRIEVRYERLKLVTLALWELVKDSTGRTDEDLRQVIARLDLEDGRRDGKVETIDGMDGCTGCGRVVLHSSPRCPYCGASNEHYDPLKAV